MKAANRSRNIARGCATSKPDVAYAPGAYAAYAPPCGAAVAPNGGGVTGTAPADASNAVDEAGNDDDGGMTVGGSDDGGTGPGGTIAGIFSRGFSRRYADRNV